jgi:hypothetical protein
VHQEIGAELAAELDSTDRQQPGLFARLATRTTEEEMA